LVSLQFYYTLNLREEDNLSTKDITVLNLYCPQSVLCSEVLLYVVAADYHESSFDGSGLCTKHALVKGSGVCSPRKILESRECICCPSPSWLVKAQIVSALSLKQAVVI